MLEMAAVVRCEAHQPPLIAPRMSDENDVKICTSGAEISAGLPAIFFVIEKFKIASIELKY